MKTSLKFHVDTNFISHFGKYLNMPVAIVFIADVGINMGLGPEAPAAGGT